ncbi:HypC/HybG/HupF family hydrogenase formation chaperone [Planotetraspora sp. A-T 1434]|uniref:HypC/HybG/HupF family hydrogenase formation chaperone n=1 Tax=Planotetraspora sp. A-T 1434 TaxID=2979219 RepID=UPI0021C096F1|nr:HypC/HybG/HupF family hydrogenase formation chaperone [Planotetraspora sp. A-T 1434]MCT9932209.1 HypC/HybG/HupF family hydrogenase formation chaperone [Planotetraspora sp. A-T 1434]
MTAHDPARTGPSVTCHAEVCVTCSDEAVPVTVVSLLEADLAVVDTGRGREEVSVALVEARVGDTILVHAKEAIAVLGSAGASEGPARQQVGVRR